MFALQPLPPCEQFAAAEQPTYQWQDLPTTSSRVWNLPTDVGLQIQGWYPNETHRYLDGPHSEDEYLALINQLARLPDGTTLPVRSRDCLPVSDDDDSDARSYTEWEYGVAVKYTQPRSGPRLFFLHASGQIEDWRLSGLSYENQVHFVDPASLDVRAIQLTQSALSRLDDNKVVIICHGWSPHVGPNYPIVKSLEYAALQAGWKTVVPSFVSSYRLGKHRGRSERVKLLLEELLVLTPRPSTLVLVGHSQGGAVVSLACSERVVRAMNIKGLLLLGSESPLSMDGMNFTPSAVPHVHIVHAEKDQVISADEMEIVAQRWRVPFTVLPSRVRSGARAWTGDDIAHDFMTADLFQPVQHIFLSFLAQVVAGSSAQPPAPPVAQPERRRRLKRTSRRKQTTQTSSSSSVDQ